MRPDQRGARFHRAFFIGLSPLQAICDARLPVVPWINHCTPIFCERDSEEWKVRLQHRILRPKEFTTRLETRDVMSVFIVGYFRPRVRQRHFFGLGSA